MNTANGGLPATTPSLDRLAGRGVTFMDATAHAPLTAPSHASIMTGQYPPHHGLRDNGGGVAPSPSPAPAGLARGGVAAARLGSAGRRGGHARLLRNVAVAVGNSGDARARPPLERLARHGDPLVREHAEWGLERLASCR